MIEVQGLSQRYGDYLAVRELSFQIGAGEVVGFLGPNGAGKSTTLKVLAGFTPPSQGTVRVAGLDVATHSLQVRERVGYLPEHTPLYDDMRVEPFLEFVARVRGVADRRAAVGDVLERCRLGEVLGRPIAELSKGYRQRVGIAQALLHDPAVLILDEPTHGLDPNQVLEVRGLVRELGQERTVLFSSHILSEVEASCRRVLVIHQGRLVADDEVDALKQRATGGAYRLRAQDPPADFRERLEALDAVARLEVQGDALRLEPPTPEQRDALAAAVCQLAQTAGVTLLELAPQEARLEDVFQLLTAPGEEAARAEA
ncbi:MAG: ATP-binding cassette domain-containing protein [Planctomycetota bacterium]